MHHKSKRVKNEATRKHNEAGHARGLLPVLLVAQLMVILDITAVNIALPSVAGDLQLSGSAISWTITSYSLVFGSLLLLGGRAADQLGRKRMFMTGLAIFTASSLASAMAGSAATLFASRAGQGLGAAMLSPAALAIIMSAFNGHQRAKALAAWGAVGGAGAAIGVLVGGVLTEIADWRTIFYINVPVAAALAIAALKTIPADAHRPRWAALDVRGALIATTSLGAIVFAITQAGSVGWLSAQTLLVGIAGLTGLAAFAALERRTLAPLMRIERLADRAVGGGLLLMLGSGRVALRALPAQFPLPAERARNGAPDPPVSPSCRSPSPLASAPTRPRTLSASMAFVARSRERSWSARSAWHSLLTSTRAAATSATSCPACSSPDSASGWP